MTIPAYNDGAPSEPAVADAHGQAWRLELKSILFATASGAAPPDAVG